MNGDKAFIDTNILVYAFTKDEPEKQETAIELLSGCHPVVSTQVLKEFSNVLIKKTNAGIPAIIETVNEIIAVTEVVNEETPLLFAAFGILEKYGFSFYDSLIVAAALKSQCRILLSEDMQDGQVIENTLEIFNPFR